jgi:FkbM family methyltransferase
VKISWKTARFLCRIISPPGRLAQWLLDLGKRHIQAPLEPIIVSARGDFARFEICDVSDRIQRSILYLGYWGGSVSRLLRRVLSPGDTFIDVGANVGWFTLLAAHLVGPAGRVVAFEPCPITRKHLERNVDLNPYRNVLVEQSALSDRPGAARLLRVLSGVDGSFSIIGRVPAHGSSFEVSTARFDDYHQDHQLGRVKLMKVDVEGEELLVGGMQSVLKRHLCDFIVLEASEWQLRRAGASIADFLNLLGSNGYDCAILGWFGTKPIRDHRNPRSATLFAAVRTSR